MSETDLISRQQAINALWKALYAYEDKTEKQFQESDELDVYDWILHREFVQNMSDIDRQVIRDLPSAQPDMSGNMSGTHKSLDCISREDAIDVLAYFDEKDPLGHTPQQIIMALPSVQPEQQWIPIEEQCPEPNEMVLISINGEVDADWIAVDLTGYGCWYRAMKDVMSVDAWKPLPEPWRGEKHDR